MAGTGATESLLIDGTTVELSNGNSEITATNGMTASVALAGGTATVTISRASGISAAAMATLVDNLAYGNTSEDPGSASRVVTVTSLRDDGLNGGGNDNINSTLAVSSTVAVTPVNDEPTLTTTGLNPGFTENGAAVDLFSTPVVASAIEAGQNLNTLVLTVSNVAGTGATENLTIDGTIVELTNGNSEVTATNGMTASVVPVGRRRDRHDLEGRRRLRRHHAVHRRRPRLRQHQRKSRRRHPRGHPHLAERRPARPAAPTTTSRRSTSPRRLPSPRSTTRR